MTDDRPFDASFANSDRYTAPKDDETVQVMVDGTLREGSVLGHNGPRTQVRFAMDNATYVRWFDTDDVVAS